jgi:multimeric flavodoxin WrbA
MKMLGIYGSPRKGGNTDILLDQALKGAAEAGAEVTSIRCCDLNISGCRECGGCSQIGKCSQDDDMQWVYPMLREADVIIIASPIFFYGITSQLKALIDRCQAAWCKRMQEKTPAQRRTYDRGHGYLICAGATKGANLFDGAKLVAKYFFDALDMSFEGGVFVKSVEAKGAVLERPDVLEEAFELGREAVLGGN